MTFNNWRCIWLQILCKLHSKTVKIFLTKSWHQLHGNTSNQIQKNLLNLYRIWKARKVIGLTVTEWTFTKSVGSSKILQISVIISSNAENRIFCKLTRRPPREGQLKWHFRHQFVVMIRKYLNYSSDSLKLWQIAT